MLPLGKKVILLDGGFGSELERLGLGEAVPEELNLSHPEAVRAIHRSYAEAGADIIMLDNMSDEEMRAAVAAIAGRAVVEISGNVTAENIARLRSVGADVVSCGAITHSAPVLDVSLKNLHAV